MTPVSPLQSPAPLRLPCGSLPGEQLLPAQVAPPNPCPVRSPSSAPTQLDPPPPPAAPLQSQPGLPPQFPARYPPPPPPPPEASLPGLPHSSPFESLLHPVHPP